MQHFFEAPENQNHPLQALNKFLLAEQAKQAAKQYEKLRFAGYVLSINYEEAVIITSEGFKNSIGRMPQNSILIATCPDKHSKTDPHFLALRVLESAPTPLERDIQQTFFDMQKRSMSKGALDPFTKKELQWGGVRTRIIGTYYVNGPNVGYAGDIDSFSSPLDYSVYSPDDELLTLILNSLVPGTNRFEIGQLRWTECRVQRYNNPYPKVPIFVSVDDFKGTRTAMFGKTRLGKSNVVKLIAQSVIETTKKSKNVGQLIFDINGEYANDNPQDDNLSLKGGYPDDCMVYASNPRRGSDAKVLKLNFYDQPDKAISVLRTLLRRDGRSYSGYVDNFANVELSSLDEIDATNNHGEKIRAVRKILFFWAILHKAGFDATEKILMEKIPSPGTIRGINPGLKCELRQAAYESQGIENIPDKISTLDQLVLELDIISIFQRENEYHPTLSNPDTKQPIFDPHDKALLEFLRPAPGRSGTRLIQPYGKYHSFKAGNYIQEIIDLLEKGTTVILDLGNADPELLAYYSDELSVAIFRHQLDLFTQNKLGDKYVQIYFEEAHNLFPKQDDMQSIYNRFAKEGAKYHIGMVYSTQSPSTISKDLLAQTENFFIAHLSSVEEIKALVKLNGSYEDFTKELLRCRTPGYLKMQTRSHRFVIPVQAHKFSAENYNVTKEM